MDESDFSAHIASLSKQDWEKLFDIIPEIEATEVFSSGGDLIQDKKNPEKFRITPEIEAPVVFKFIDIMEELDLVFGFNWSEWEYGKSIFEKREFENLDIITLLKLINALIRSDHFSYGSALASRFQDGTIGKILKEIKKNIETT